MAIDSESYCDGLVDALFAKMIETPSILRVSTSIDFGGQLQRK